MLYKIEALTPARVGRQIKIEALLLTLGTVDLGPEPKIQSVPSTFPFNFGPRCLVAAFALSLHSGFAALWVEVSDGTSAHVLNRVFGRCLSVLVQTDRPDRRLKQK